MNGFIATILLGLFVAIPFVVPVYGGPAVLAGAFFALVAMFFIKNVEANKQVLLSLFLVSLLLRVMIGTVIFKFRLQDFFGGDAITYDQQGFLLTQIWQGNARESAIFLENPGGFWGMPYFVAAIYSVIGRNMLAVQYANAVFGAATVPLMYLSAEHIFNNQKVARMAAWLVAVYPSLVLWSSQGLKDAPIVFLLALAMLATLKLGEHFSTKYLLILIGALIGLLSLRFYIFYMVAVTVGSAFIIGMRQGNTASIVRRFMIVIILGLALTYVGVLRTASVQLETFGNLEAVNRSRLDLATSADSGFGKEVDVSTTSGALSAIPLGIVYLLFAPFPWQLANLRQSITLPEMLLWWSCFPLLVLGLGFTLKYRLRQSLPILLFTTMLTLAYSIFQGNVGTAYRQRSQLLVFYFIFVAVGFVLLRERSEDRGREARAARKMVTGDRRPQQQQQQETNVAERA
ncbi:MAG TPA: glycosyltransferase family 39 protein [Pyrinomonadaceae bacterium]|nr:glycosyltransferase family 39 protein [Pyrinomonadaceae bacterium]